MIDRKVERYERALLAIATSKAGPLTDADHERAVQVASMVERYEADLRAPVKPARVEPAAPAAPRVARAPGRKRRRRKAAQPVATVPKRRGRPPKLRPPEEDIPG